MMGQDKRDVEKIKDSETVSDQSAQEDATTNPVQGKMSLDSDIGRDAGW